MNHCFKEGKLSEARAWLAESGASIGLLQESAPPAVRNDLYDQVATPGRVAWGTGIWTAGHQVRAVAHRATVPGGAVGGEAPSSEGPITLISVYGQLEGFLGTQWSIPNLHRILSDLTPLLADHKRRGRIVLGGDFNAGVTFDKDRIGGLRSHSLLFDRLEAFGLKSVIPYRDASDQTVTWKGSGEKQSDYVFVSEELAYRDPELRWHNELSDHAAIMVDVDLPEPTGL
jgi:hypothetical protein